MSYDFAIKTGDSRPPLKAVMRIGRSRLDLTEAKEVVLVLKRGATASTHKMEVTDAKNGEVECSFDWNDLTVAGVYKGEVRIVWKEGAKDEEDEVQTIPNERYLEVLVTKSLNGSP